MAQKKKTSSMSMGKKIEIGAGIGAAVAAVAGAYFLYGTKAGQKEAKKIKGWMLKLQGSVLEKMEAVEAVTEDMYRKMIDEAVSEYKAIKGVTPADVATYATSLKNHWKNIEKEMVKVGRKVVKKIR